MKLNTLAFSALLALAAAQESTTTAASTTASLSPEDTCIKKCDPKDVCCIAACNHVPCPSDSQANDTTKCAAACPQGNGSASDTDAYASCQAQCYSSHFFPATMTGSVALPTGDNTATTTGSGSSETGKASGSASMTGTGSSSSETGSGSGSGSGSDSSSESGSSTASGSGAAPTKTDNAAVVSAKLGASAVGFLGLIAAALIL